MEKYGVDVMVKHVFQGSLAKALTTAYPEHRWNPWQFRQNLSVGFWSDLGNQRAFMEWLGKELGYKEMKDWYNLTGEDVAKNGGGSLLTNHRGSPSLLVRSVFPEHTWGAHWFGKVPQGHWKDMANTRAFVDWLGKELGFKEMRDWYKLTKEDVTKNGGSGLLSHYRGSPSLLVRSVFPEHTWETHQFGTVKDVGQQIQQ